MSPWSLSRRHTLLLAAVLLVGLLLAGRQLGRGEAFSDTSSAPRSGRVQMTAAPAPRLVVHVVGAVRRAGLYRLAQGARIADAVNRAGGATRRADLALVNLAAPVSDGTQVVVPRRAAPSAPTDSGVAGSERGQAASGPVRLNTASLEQLDALPGVGPVTAQKILDYRQQHGAFSSIDDLDEIPGIGPARLEQLREAAAP
ncbi:MAG: helix-hairpin-helix domain-containing protein [Actinobacteria bacterium]|nr:helix-hairpin-helix domain-containing protein [Actinomycetota bacterium]